MKKTLLVLTLLLSLTAWAAGPMTQSTTPGRAGFTEAERLIGEGSYRLALEIYQSVDPDRLPVEQARWVRFRRADLLWRSAPEDADDTPLQRAERELRRLLVDDEGRPIEDAVRPEILESLGDLYQSSRRRNFGQAWQFYAQALDVWAKSTSIDLARQRYLGIVFKAAAGADDGWNPRGSWATNLPIQVLENAVRIAEEPGNRGRANYLLALHLANRHDPETVERTRAAFEHAIDAGRTDWRDDALYRYASWLTSSGRLEFDEDSNRFRIRPDWEGAVRIFEMLVREYARGESRWRDQAETQLRTIREPSIALAVPSVFLPGSEIEIGVTWRNVGSVDYTLTRVDLTESIALSGRRNLGEWLQAIESPEGANRVRWSRTLDRRDRYEPGQDRVRIPERLEAGAWLLEARSGSTSARDLVLVTDLAITTRASSDGLLAWIVDARSGEPRARASIRAWQQIHREGASRIVDRRGTSDAEGLTMIDFETGQSGQALIVAKWNDRQAILPLYAHFGRRGRDESWRIYAYTDRPAYRPDETVQWKITARVGGVEGYSVPSGETLGYVIRDPRGTEVATGELKLNAFGSAWDELALTSTMPLGEYRIEFQSIDPQRSVGGAVLFRLEEYKLPEFRVSVSTAGPDGTRRLYRTGDEVEATIEASYYFGGPVANATVEVVVRETPWYRPWRPERDHPWLFEARLPSPGWHGGGREVLQERLVLDSEGRATFSFPTPASANQDFEYRVEARVTDASRREIIGAGTVRVTRAPYSADARPDHFLHRPGDPIEVTFRAVDANDQPAKATGTYRITREQWREIWLDPHGREVTGAALEEAKRTAGVFPPPREPGRHPWLLVERGYEREEVRTGSLSTNEKGRAVIRHTPEREGFYRFEIATRPVGLENPRPRDLVEAGTTVWVATSQTTRLGYHHEGGVQIILDEESVRAGSRVPVMLVAPVAGRSVLFTVETDRILSRRVIPMSGNVRLLDLELGDEHIPNVFLTATMVADLQLHHDTKELIVPPVEKFLEIEVTPDQQEYRPRDKGRLDITVRDAEGNPVAAELALGVADESVYSISEDLAGDPRKLFYGERRQHGVRLYSSFGFRRYQKLIEIDGRILDERLAQSEIERRQRGDRDEREEGVQGGVISGVVGKVAESITVSAESPAHRAAPVPMPAPQAANEMAADAAAEPPDAGGEVIVRSDFRSTIFWKPDLMTGDDGRASVEITFPDSLTTWRATARAATVASQFGIATSASRTSQPFIVRLQAPRFFVVGDETVVSAVLNNNTEESLRAVAAIDIAGLELERSSIEGSEAVTVEPGGETRVDWVVAAREPGVARLRVSARAGQLSDAMERSLPVEDHGIDKLLAISGKMRGTEATVRLELPAERRKDSTSLVIRVTPSIAVTMLDAMPYLIDYPYGCTEQTMSRFLPTVVVARTLAELGVPRQTVATRLFGGIEPVHADQTHARGRRDLTRLDEMTRAGLARLVDFQHADGGWGWWKEGDSDRFMTAYVLWGLALARDAGVNVRPQVIERGADYLRVQLVQEEARPERQAWMLQALSAAKPGNPGRLERAAFENVWAKRERMSAYAVALLALAAHEYGLNDQAGVLARNLENGAVVDRSPDRSILIRGGGSSSDLTLATAHWGSTGRWWRWNDGPVESTAFALRALSAIDPDHRLIEPAMNWLVKNRRGAQWSNTRDTAIAILALNEYLGASGQLDAATSFEVIVNGRSVGTREIPRGGAIAAPSRFDVPKELIVDGANQIVVRRTSGDGTLYVAAEARFFSREEPVTAAGHELFVEREYFRLVPHPTLLEGMSYEKVPLGDQGSVRSGERIEVVVRLEAKNDYEYLVIEDFKPAGFEAVAIRSGEPLWVHRLGEGSLAAERPVPGLAVTGQPAPRIIDSRRVHQELRDRKVAMFIDSLGQGVWEIRYTLRAEVPGFFHALPVIGHAMYVPEIRGNGEEIRVSVVER